MDIRPRDFVKYLIDEMHVKRRGQSTPWEDFEAFQLQLWPPLRLNVPLLMYFLVAEKSYQSGVLSGTEVDLLKGRLREFNQQHSQSISVLVVGASAPLDHKQLNENEYPEQVAILDGAAMLAIMSEKDRTERTHLLGKLLVKQLGVLMLSPYNADVPAARGAFFGRAETIREILSSNKSYTFIGPRRIGKTSLLKEIRNRMEATYTDPHLFRTANIIATKYASTAEIVSEIVGALLERHAMKEAYKTAARSGRAEAKFKHMIQDLDQRGHRIAVFIDEFDYVLELDAKQGYACMALLHAAFDQRSQAQLFLAGFRQTFRARLDNRTPLYGFTEVREIGPLSAHETREMITKPLADLGIPIEEAVTQRIAADSAGHPQVITYFCNAYLKYYEKYQKIPDDDYIITHVLGSPELKRRVKGTFFTNVTPFEELVCMLLMRKALQSRNGLMSFEFGLKQVDALLQQWRVNLSARAISAICESLRLCSIIHEVGGTEKYRFTFPQLVKFFDDHDLDWLIQKSAQAVKELKSDPDNLYKEGLDLGLLEILEESRRRTN